MSIGNISSDSILSRYSISNLSVNTVSATDTEDSAGISSVSSAKSDSVDFSKPSEMMSKLQKLKETDPEKFKEVCNNISEKLSSTAEESGDKMLSDLAAKFQDVANGGDISQLKPPAPPEGGQRPQGVAAYSQNAESASANMVPPQNGQNGNHADMKSIMDSIFSEIDSAIGE